MIVTSSSLANCFKVREISDTSSPILRSTASTGTGDQLQVINHNQPKPFLLLQPAAFRPNVMNRDSWGIVYQDIRSA